MAAAGYISWGTCENSFADELVKMSQGYYARQGARTTKAVKIAHMGRLMAHQQDELEKLAYMLEYEDLTPEEYEMIKEAISLGGIKQFISGAAKNVNRLADKAGPTLSSAAKSTRQAGSNVASRINKATGQIGKGRGAQFPKMPGVDVPNLGAPVPTARRGMGLGSGPRAPVVKGPMSMPTGPGKLVGPGGSVQLPGARSPFDPGALGGVKETIGNVAGKVRSGAGQMGAGFQNVPLQEGAGIGQKLLHRAGGIGAGALGASDSVFNQVVGGSIALPAAMRAGGAVLDVGKRMLGSRGVVKNVAKAGRGAVADVAQAGAHAPSLGRDALQHAVSKGMSPTQLQAAENLHSQGANLSRGGRKKLERMAGIKYDDIVQHGGLSNAVMAKGTGSAGGLGKVKEVKDLASDVADQVGGAGGAEAAGAGAGAAGGVGGMAGKVKDFFTQPLGTPGQRLAMGAAGVALPVAGGLGLYGAYHGMNALSAANQQSQYQHGSMGAPINYSQTSMFPAGQISY